MAGCGNIFAAGPSIDSMRRRTFLQLAAAAPAFAQTAKSRRGFPGRSGAVPTAISRPKPPGLKDQWPASGPKVVWKRPLGEGYSSPAVENDVLYTMYGRPQEEVVLACDAATGKTLWEHATPMTFQSDAPDMGNGPYSTPLIVGRPAIHYRCRRTPAVDRQEDRASCFGRSSSGTITRARGSCMAIRPAPSPIATP